MPPATPVVPFLVPFLVLVLAAFAASAYAELLQVQIIHRHGAREPLRKDAASPSGETTDPALLPAGVTQLVDLGSAVRQRYYPDNASSATTIKNSSADYRGPADAGAYSSALGRTLSSSRAFLRGLYPDANETDRIPTTVFALSKADWILRGYTLCPAFSASVKQFINSAAFTTRAAEVDSEGVLKRVAAGINENKTLADAFNVYDRYTLSIRGFLEHPLPNITAQDYQAVAAAAAWVESRKFATRAVGGGRAAGGMLSQLIVQSEAMLAAGSNAHRLVEYSAHYPLMFGVYAALGLDEVDFDTRDNVTRAIPDFGAALVWELHSGSEVKLFLRNGTGTNFTPIPCGADGKLSCDLKAMKSKLSDAGALYATADEFCRACGTDAGVNGVVCDATSSGKASGSGAANGSLASKAKYGLSGVLVGLLLAVSCILLWFFCCGRSKYAAQQGPITALIPGDDMDYSVEQSRTVDIGASSARAAYASNVQDRM
jgi:Histidine phosphatase superfamily (branch 2)